jgi:hypothetical protein
MHVKQKSLVLVAIVKKYGIAISKRCRLLNVTWGCPTEMLGEQSISRHLLAVNTHLAIYMQFKMS